MKSSPAKTEDDTFVRLRKPTFEDMRQSVIELNKTIPNRERTSEFWEIFFQKNHWTPEEYDHQFDEFLKNVRFHI
jgi:hypothetical protein